MIAGIHPVRAGEEMNRRGEESGMNRSRGEEVPLSVDLESKQRRRSAASIDSAGGGGENMACQFEKYVSLMGAIITFLLEQMRRHDIFKFYKNL